MDQSCSVTTRGLIAASACAFSCHRWRPDQTIDHYSRQVWFKLHIREWSKISGAYMRIQGQCVLQDRSGSGVVAVCLWIQESSRFAFLAAQFPRKRVRILFHRTTAPSPTIPTFADAIYFCQFYPVLARKKRRKKKKLTETKLRVNWSHYLRNVTPVHVRLQRAATRDHFIDLTRSISSGEVVYIYIVSGHACRQ